MRSLLLLLTTASTWTLASCQSTPLPVPIELGAPIDATYDGGVATTCWLHDSLDQLPKRPEQFDESTPKHSVSMSVYTTSREIAAQVMHSIYGVTTNRVDGPSARATFAEIEATHPGTLAQTSQLTLFEGQKGYLALMTQTAFVEGFEFESAPGAFLADPEVSIARDGVILTLEPGADSMWFEFVSSNLQRPISTIEIFDHHGGTAPLTVQVPIYVNDRVRGTIDLADAHGILISGVPTRDPDRVMFALLERTLLERSQAPL